MARSTDRNDDRLSTVSERRTALMQEWARIAIAALTVLVPVILAVLAKWA